MLGLEVFQLLVQVTRMLAGHARVLSLFAASAKLSMAGGAGAVNILGFFDVDFGRCFRRHQVAAEQGGACQCIDYFHETPK